MRATETPVDGPAKYRFGQVESRNLTAQAGSKKGVINIRAHPLLAAFHIRRPKISQDEFSAGEVYRVAWGMRYPVGVDPIARIGMVVNQGHRDMSDRQINASTLLRKIDDSLMRLCPPNGEPHLTIIRQFCGEGRSARAACYKAGVADPRFTWIMVRLALSKLSTAISRTGLTFSEK